MHYSTVFPELAVTVHSTSTLKIAAKSTGIILSKDRGMAWDGASGASVAEPEAGETGAGVAGDRFAQSVGAGSTGGGSGESIWGRAAG